MCGTLVTLLSLWWGRVFMKDERLWRISVMQTSMEMFVCEMGEQPGGDQRKAK